MCLAHPREFYTTNMYWIAFAIFFAISTPLVLAFSAKQYHSMYESYATQQAYAEAEKKFYSECFSIGVIEEIRSCLANSIESAREPQRAEEDVSAQKEMALWAFWMLVATATLGTLTLAATVSGAVFLWRSIQDTREHFATDQRPWLRLGRPSVSVRRNGDDVMVFLEIKAENIGKSPASDVDLFMSVVPRRMPVASAVGVRRFAEQLTDLGWPPGRRLVFPERSRKLVEASEWLSISVNSKPATDLCVRYCVTYTGSGINRILRTAGEAIVPIYNVPDTGDDFAGVDWFIFYGVSFAD